MENENLDSSSFGGVANPINSKMAASFITILPMLIVLLVFNRPIINGLTKKNGGGNKG